jgi:hypothetical protein
MIGAALLLAVLTANSLPTAGEVLGASAALGGADLMFMSNPAGDWPVRVMVASSVSASADKVEQVIRDPASYATAMPSFNRVQVVSQQEREPGIIDTEVAWELEIPLRNLKGKLWLRPQPGGVDLAFSDGDFAPGLLQLRARTDKGNKKQSPCLLTVEGSANMRDINWATRKIVARSGLAEPAITAAAVFVMTKALAGLSEGKAAGRPKAALSAPQVSTLGGASLGKVFASTERHHGVWATIHSRADGRLSDVEVAVAVASPVDKAQSRTLRAATFGALPGWKKVALVTDKSPPDECKDLSTLCWSVDNNLPVFSLSGTWKIWPRPWRARMVAGDTRGAVMGLHLQPAASAAESVVVLSQHPRLDKAGFVARKLIDAEPFLEHGLALALTLMDAVALGPALAQSKP